MASTARPKRTRSPNSEIAISGIHGRLAVRKMKPQREAALRADEKCSLFWDDLTSLDFCIARFTGRVKLQLLEMAGPSVF